MPAFRSLRRVGNPAWVRYSERFYERRWFVPAIAAAIRRSTDGRASGDVPHLLRSARPLALCAPAAASKADDRVPRRRRRAVLAPVLFIAGLPLMDVCGARWRRSRPPAALLALERSLRWLALWIVALVAAVADTRLTVVLSRAALACPARTVTPNILIAAAGAAAALPLPLALGAPVREAMAYTFENFLPAAGRELGLGRKPLLVGRASVARPPQPDLSSGASVHSALSRRRLPRALPRPLARRPLHPLLPRGRGRVDPPRCAPAELHGVPARATFVPIAAAGLAVGLSSLRDTLLGTQLAEAGSVASRMTTAPRTRSRSCSSGSHGSR